MWCSQCIIWFHLSTDIACWSLVSLCTLAAAWQLAYNIKSTHLQVLGPGVWTLTPAMIRMTCEILTNQRESTSSPHPRSQWFTAWASMKSIWHVLNPKTKILNYGMSLLNWCSDSVPIITQCCYYLALFSRTRDQHTNWTSSYLSHWHFLWLTNISSCKILNV